MLLDVREDSEWDDGHVAGAISLPMSRLAAEVQSLPADRVLICVCHVGMRSAMAARALTGAGWNAVNLAGGMMSWYAAGLPIVQDADQADAVA